MPLLKTRSNSHSWLNKQRGIVDEVSYIIVRAVVTLGWTVLPAGVMGGLGGQQAAGRLYYLCVLGETLSVHTHNDREGTAPKF